MTDDERYVIIMKLPNGTEQIYKAYNDTKQKTKTRAIKKVRELTSKNNYSASSRGIRYSLQRWTEINIVEENKNDGTENQKNQTGPGNGGPEEKKLLRNSDEASGNADGCGYGGDVRFGGPGRTFETYSENQTATVFDDTPVEINEEEWDRLRNRLRIGNRPTIIESTRRSSNISGPETGIEGIAVAPDSNDNRNEGFDFADDEKRTA